MDLIGTRLSQVAPMHRRWVVAVGAVVLVGSAMTITYFYVKRDQGRDGKNREQVTNEIDHDDDNDNPFFLRKRSDLIDYGVEAQDLRSALPSRTHTHRVMNSKFLDSVPESSNFGPIVAASAFHVFANNETIIEEEDTFCIGQDSYISGRSKQSHTHVHTKKKNLVLVLKIVTMRLKTKIIMQYYQLILVN